MTHPSSAGALVRASPPRVPHASASAAPPSALYRAVWRWHFYAGLVCMPFLFMMAVTGALYLFHDEIESIVYRDLLVVGQDASPARPAEQLVAAALAAEPGRLTRYVPAPAAGRSVEVGVRRADSSVLAVYVDPHTARVLGSIRDDRRLMEVVKGVHSLAIAGPVANHWIEIVAGWTIVLVVSGACLWWPRGRSGGVVAVRAAPAQRLWWRDLHAVTGAVAAVVVLFLAVTGMPWSAFWGERFGQLTNALGVGLPEYVWVKRPQSQVPLSSQGDVPWSMRQAAVPQSAPLPTHADAHAGHHAAGPSHDDAHAAHHGAAPPPAAPGAAIGLDAALAAFERLGLQAGFRVTVPADARGVYTAMRFTDDVRDARVVHLDQYSGKALIDIGYADYGVVGKLTDWGVGVHTGKQFGLVNQLVMLFGCIAVVTLAITAAVMWWKRRPQGRLAAPQRRPNERAAAGAVAIAVLLGLVYPLLGASMLVALLVDALVPRRWHERFGL
ncbi:PepSY-associated TM helix domain-containing protein [Piscinibacter koreensis]|uniref:PepSY domain-containing protein n=1 Tax=Piscinibacter koreensis TaxID=2742824 RepID=A0A7Y6NPB8_9BURK|nr:PepSY domain-containing protein [Schlegelella koreensis]NUZ06806.1 PepSY domain-containing protein [Schlegelella koreensis]